METIKADTGGKPGAVSGEDQGGTSVPAMASGESGELSFQFMMPKLLDQLSSFKSRYLGSRGGAAFAVWKYRQGPVDCGDCKVIALAPDGSIVGHLGAVILPSVPGSRLPFLALGTEFIVDEKYRGGKHDTIRKMDNMLGERLTGKGAGMMYANPNKYGYIVSRRLYRRVDGVDCAYLSKVFTPALATPPGPMRKAVHRLFSLRHFPSSSLPAGWAWNRPARFEAAEIDGFCREFMGGLDFGVARNADFLNWRYGGGDGCAYERILVIGNGTIAGLAVLRIDPDRCVGAALMEGLALDARGYDVLLGVCLRHVRRRAPALSVYGVKDSPFIQACIRHGFRPNADILARVRRALAWAPAKISSLLLAKAENHFQVDDRSTLFYYPEPKRSQEYIQGRWYLTLGEKFGF